MLRDEGWLFNRRIHDDSCKLSSLENLLRQFFLGKSPPLDPFRGRQLKRNPPHDLAPLGTPPLPPLQPPLSPTVLPTELLPPRRSGSWPHSDDSPKSVAILYDNYLVHVMREINPQKLTYGIVILPSKEHVSCIVSRVAHTFYCT